MGWCESCYDDLSIHGAACTPRVRITDVEDLGGYDTRAVRLSLYSVEVAK